MTQVQLQAVVAPVPFFEMKQFSVTGESHYREAMKRYNRNRLRRNNPLFFGDLLMLFQQCRNSHELASILRVGVGEVREIYYRYVRTFLPEFCPVDRRWLNFSWPKGNPPRIARINFVDEFIKDAIRKGLAVKRILVQKHKKYLERSLMVNGKKCHLYQWKKRCKVSKVFYELFFRLSHFHKDCDLIILVLRKANGNNYFIIPALKLFELANNKDRVGLYLPGKDNFGAWKEFDGAWNLLG